MSSTPKSKVGYCPTCHKNVPHERRIVNPLFVTADKIGGKFLWLVRLGPWYCVHCDHKLAFLSYPKPDAPEYRSGEIPTDSELEISPTQWPKTKSSRATEFHRPEKEVDTATPVGNFIKSENSLVMKSKRLQRFSEKYRDAVVRRIYSGTTTLTQVREDKQLSEGDIVDWMADLFDRQREKIDRLTASAEQGNLIESNEIHTTDNPNSTSVRPR